jgi:hypothetical protein
MYVNKKEQICILNKLNINIHVLVYTCKPILNFHQL